MIWFFIIATALIIIFVAPRKNKSKEKRISFKKRFGK
jgi:hypothetical protein